MEEPNNIISRDRNINQTIYQILNEAFQEFKQIYGTKHSNHIKEKIESVTDKVREYDYYYSGPIASANAEAGVIFTKSDKLSAVLKHEMWHVYNDAASDREYSLQHIPQRYMKQLEQSGYLKALYTQKMEEYKEKWKDEPLRLEHLLVDYEEWKNNSFDFEDSPVELWTEYFNTQTHLKDMNDNYWDWGEGFFTKSHSSDSFYDSYINIAGLLSCIIPKKKLLEMYLYTGDYQTEYSYPQMLEEFDAKYANVLSENEKEKYQYPFLKIIMNIRAVSENAKSNPKVARESLQDCMKTCFDAYSIKLDNVNQLDVDKLREIYFEIKYMQELMVWNIDKSKMQGFDYIESMRQIQDKFKVISSSLGIDKQEIQDMVATIDFEQVNPYRMIENGEFLASKIYDAQEEKNLIIDYGKYKALIGKNGVKDNLYNSVFVLLGENKYNLLFQNDNNENLLLKFHQKIQSANGKEDIISIYNELYELYEKKMIDNLKTDENIEQLFNRYSNDIVELQKNALFDDKNQMYLPQLESIIRLYDEKVKEYESKIDKITDEDKIKYIARGKTEEEAEKFAKRLPNMYKNELHEQQNRINSQRIQQTKIFSTKEFSELEIGKSIIDRSVKKIDKAKEHVNEAQITENRENSVKEY